MNTLISQLNHPDKTTRIATLRELMNDVKTGLISRPQTGIDVNNHIHTSYSFSPYSPTSAVWHAWQAGLCSAGIMDHDTIVGGLEFVEAGKIVGLATTIGIECRVDCSKTKLAGKRINNPDQNSVAYIAIHGVPHGEVDTITAFFRPLIERRNVRNKKMVDRINQLISSMGIIIDFDKDIVPLSWYNDGGVVTERHLIYGLVKALSKRFLFRKDLVKAITSELKVALSDKVANLVLDPSNVLYEWDLLGALKAELVGQFYVDATDECPPIADVLALSKKIGAISAYAYLGDVGNSVTGDKKTQSFEDSYLDVLFDELETLGFDAVTYMPSRNTPEQLARVQAKCAAAGFFQISGEDINSPRQGFIIPAIRTPQCSHLIDSTWALIGHEKEATLDKKRGMFAPEVVKKMPALQERIAFFAKRGRAQDNCSW